MNIQDRIRLGMLRRRINNKFVNITINCDGNIRNIEIFKGIIISDSYLLGNLVGRGVWNYFEWWYSQNAICESDFYNSSPEIEDDIGLTELPIGIKNI